MPEPTRVTLPDHHELVVRPIRADDKANLRAIFDGLSEESRYRRFFAVMGSLPAGMQAYLTEVDHHDHEALLALDAATGAPVAVGRYIRLKDRPRAAEFAITVVDAWQRRAVGTAMFALLLMRAHEEGIEQFVGDVLTQNMLMHRLMAMFGPVTMSSRDGVVEHLVLPVPSEELAARLPELLEASVAYVPAGHP